MHRSYLPGLPICPGDSRISTTLYDCTTEKEISRKWPRVLSQSGLQFGNLAPMHPRGVPIVIVIVEELECT